MSDDDYGTESAAVAAAAGQPLDHTDAAVLAEVARLLEDVDPLPEGLVERVQFALALDEVYSEVAELTRMPAESLAVRDDAAGVRTETLTFTADALSAMITVTRIGGDRVRVDGWLAPERELRVRVRMADGHTETVHSDLSGRFVFEDLPAGMAQMSFHEADSADSADSAAHVVVTPLFQL